MNDYNIIANYLLGNPSYCFEIDGYWFPKFIGKANLDYFRKQELKEESSYVKNFKKDIGGKKYKSFLKNYIQEFPFPIEHIDTWHELLKMAEVEEGSKPYNTKYFKLDFFYPELKLCIEIDSSYHYAKSKYDLARDSYLSSVYGIKTIRLLNYGENEKNRKLNSEILKTETDKLMTGPKIPLNFNKYVAEKFIEDNQDIFSQIIKVRNQIGNKFIINRQIELNKKDLGKDWEKVVKFIEDIYKKRVILKP
jgi:hypothetical protein